MFTLEIIGTVDPELMIDPNIYARINHSNVKSIDEWDKNDVYWFIAVESIPKKTKKGKDYLQLKAWGSKGEERRIFVWDWDGKVQILGGCQNGLVRNLRCSLLRLLEQ